MRLILICFFLVSSPLWAQGNLQPKVNEFDQLLAQQQQAQAIALAAELYQQHPQDPIALMLQGRALAMQNQLPQATQLFQKAIEQDPSQVGPHFFLAQIYQSQGNFAQAAEELRIYLNERPNDNYELTYIELLARSNQPARTLAYLQHRLDQQSSKQQREQLQQQLQPIYAWAANILFRGPLIYPNNPEQLGGLQSTLNAMEAITNRGLMVNLDDGDWVVDPYLYPPQTEPGQYEDIQNIHAAVAWANMANLAKSYEFILQIRNSNARTIGMIRVAEALAPAAPALAREWLRLAEGWHELVVRNTSYTERDAMISQNNFFLGIDLAGGVLAKIDTQNAVRGEILRVLYHHFPNEFSALQAANALQAPNNINTLTVRLLAHNELDAALDLFDPVALAPQTVTQLNNLLLYAGRRADAQRVTDAFIENYENPPPDRDGFYLENTFRELSFMASDWAGTHGLGSAAKIIVLLKNNAQTDNEWLYYGDTMAWLGMNDSAIAARDNIKDETMRKNFRIHENRTTLATAVVRGNVEGALKAIREGNFDTQNDTGHVQSFIRVLRASQRWSDIEDVYQRTPLTLYPANRVAIMADLIEQDSSSGKDVTSHLESMLEDVTIPYEDGARSSEEILARAAHYAHRFGRRGDLERVRKLATSSPDQRAVHFGVLLAQMHELNQPPSASEHGTSRRR